MRIGKLIILLALITCCYSQKYLSVSNKKENDATHFLVRCMGDSCHQLKDKKKQSEISLRIDSLFKIGKIKYGIIDTNIKTDGKYYGVRLFASGYNSKVCDSLRILCEDSLPEDYHTGYVQSHEPPCLIAGCFTIAILDSELNLIWLK